MIRCELDIRGIKYNVNSEFDPDGVFSTLDHNFNNDYTPTSTALTIIRQRIAEKIMLKPNWYRYKGQRIYYGDSSAK